MIFRTLSNENVEALVSTSGYSISLEAEIFSIDQGREFRSQASVSLPASSVFSILISTGSSPVSWSRSNPKPNTDSLRVLFYEDPTVSSNGTLLPKICSNRVIKSNSLLSLYSGPVTTFLGTLISESYLPGSTGVGGSRSGGEISSGNKWILPSNSKYLIQYANESTATCYLWVGFNWRE